MTLLLMPEGPSSTARFDDTGTTLFSKMSALRLLRLELLAEVLIRREPIFRDQPHPFEVFIEEELRRRFRFGQDGIVYLAELLHRDLSRPTHQSHALTAEQQKVLALKFFATGGFLITAADLIGVHESTACKTEASCT